MKETETNFIKAFIVITIQAIVLLTIFYILSSNKEMTQLDEIQLLLSAGLILVGSFITFKSLSKLKKDEKEDKFVKQTTY